MQQPLDTPIADAASSEQHPAIIDVPMRSNLLVRNVVLGVMAFIFILMIFVWFISIIRPLIPLLVGHPLVNRITVILFIALVFIGTFKAYGAWFRAKLQRELQHHPPSSLTSVLLAVIPDRSTFIGQLLKITARQLAETGTTGVTIRACERRHAIAIEPLAVTIEPLPLDESLPSVARIAAADFDDEGNQPDDAPVNSSDDSQLRTIKRNIALSGGKVILIVFGIIWMLSAFVSIVQWRVTLGFLVLSGLIILTILSPFGGGAMTMRQQWLIVPGGLIGRRSNYRGGWNVHLFDRRESVLAVHRMGSSQWYVSVADRESHQSATITPTEVNALLRAWLSPLPPPPREQLAELAG